MTILMRSDKQLIITKNTKLYQRESVVDKLEFLIPITYDDIDLRDFSVTLEYVNPGNETKIETLVKDEDLYKDTYLRYTMPVNSEFTYFAGEVKMKLVLTKVDPAESTKYVLHTGEISIVIDTWEDYFKYVPASTLSAIDNRLLEIDNEMEKLKSISDQLSVDMVDDLALTGTLLQVSSHGVAKGNGVEMITNIEDPDGAEDAIINLGALRTIEL